MKKAVLLLSLLLVATPVYAQLLPNGEPCIINAQCLSGFCHHVCRESYCTDGTCVVQEDCHFCGLIGGMIGDCQASDCGFSTAKCDDNICETEFDCFCSSPQYGDCGPFRCMIKGNEVYFGIGIVVIGGIIYYLKKNKKLKI